MCFAVSMLMMSHLGAKPRRGGRPPSLNIIVINIKKIGVLIGSRLLSKFELILFVCIINSIRLKVIVIYTAR